MNTLTKLQDATLAEMSTPRSSPLRAQKMRAAVLRHYRKRAACLGYTEATIDVQVIQLREMLELQQAAAADDASQGVVS